jgi:hypothetical protein
MGDCESMYKHISAYTENTLDPSTRAEFEKHLDRSPELRQKTGNISKVALLLSALPEKKCSENFMSGLRERIHTEPERKSMDINIKRYSFAVSFVVLAIVAAFSVNSLLEKDQPVSPDPALNGIEASPPAVSGRSGNTSPRMISNQEEMDVKTRAESKAVKDSLSNLKADQDNARAKVVGHTK